MSPIHSRLKVLSSYKENGVRMAYTDTHVNLYRYSFGRVPPFKCQSEQPRCFIFIYYFVCGVIIKTYLKNTYRILGTSSSHLPFALGLAGVAGSKWPALRQ